MDLNQELESSSLKNVIKNLDEYLWTIANNVVCTICHDLFSNPVTISCGHSFCSNCLRKLISGVNNKKSGCPLCRNQIKRRESSNNHILSVISSICSEFPAAFKEDVKNLSSNQIELMEDLVNSSRICDITQKEKVAVRKTRGRKLKESQNESIIECSILTGPKKTEESDLKSVSQMDTASYVPDSENTEDKLKDVEDVPSDKKVCKWLKDVTDYESSCSNDVIPGSSKTTSSMIRIDYDKTKKLKEDPYEFIPSQKTSTTKRKLSTRGRKKSLPEFKSIQMFSKDSIKSNLNNSTIDQVRLSPVSSDINNEILQKTVKTYSRNASLSKTITILESQVEEAGMESVKVISSTDYNTVENSDIANQSRRKQLQETTVSDSDNSSEYVQCSKKYKTADSDSLAFNQSDSSVIQTTEGDRKALDKTQSPGWLRVSNLKNDFQESEKKRSKCRKALNISGGELNITSRSRSEASCEIISSPKDNSVYIEDLSQSSEVHLGFDSQSKNDKEHNFKCVVENMEKELEEMELDVEPVPKIEENVKRTRTRNPNRRAIPFTLLGKMKRTKKATLMLIKMGKLSTSRNTVIKLLFPNGKRKSSSSCCSVGIQTDRVEMIGAESQTSRECSVKEVQVSPVIEKKNATVQTDGNFSVLSSGMFEELATPAERIDEFDTELQCELNRTWATQQKGEEQIIDLVSRESDDVARVVQNIQLDMERVKMVRENEKLAGKDEDSDSDSIIDQTPPKKKQATPDSQEGSFLIISSVPEEENILLKTNNENNQNELNQTKKLIQETKQMQKKIKIMSSSVHNRGLIDKFVKKFDIEHLSTPKKDMTHLIVGLHKNDDGDLVPLCTPKLMFAMANKKWIVTEAWVKKCLDANKIVPEEPYESVDPVGGDGCALARKNSGLLLENCEIYLMGQYNSISKTEFSGLVEDCGGKVIKDVKKFSYAPGNIRMILTDSVDSINQSEVNAIMSKTRTVVMSRDVIIVSIQSYRLANFTSFLLHSTSTSDLLEWGYPPELVKVVDDDSIDDETNSWA